MGGKEGDVFEEEILRLGEIGGACLPLDVNASHASIDEDSERLGRGREGEEAREGDEGDLPAEGKGLGEGGADAEAGE